jgi:sugar/nucleoside kinase (ribokinase family)
MLNHYEAMEFRKLKDIKGLLSYIKGLGPKLVVITDGSNGAYAFDGQKYYFMKARSKKVINTLGVGDAFGSALTSALIYDKNIKEALTWGIENSAAVVGEIGAQKGLLKRSQINR